MERHGIDRAAEDEGSPAQRLGPEAWVEAAYAAFADGGVGAVRIDRLARTLGITRGSFYWHFENRAALLRAVLKRWGEERTERTIAENEAGGGDPRNRLRRLLRTCASDDGHLEMGMRDWAATDEAARAEIERIDDRRIAYMAALSDGAGAPANAMLARCRVAYLAWLGSYTGVTVATREQRLADMDVLLGMMLAE